jgi:asparagine synthase (glutamine-hydrolysing)
MCGICGIWDYGSPGNLRGRVEVATRAAAHRGPDDEGFALLGPRSFRAWGGAVTEEGDGTREGLHVALGHRRLSILDLSPAGHQPFSTADKRFWIVLNGEIYNYLELRAELERAGETFRSRTDTEVVLAAWKTWGESSLDRFNGMWSFAIFDRERESLFCARDRFGVKPFCYTLAPGKFAFASETKQILGEAGARPALHAPSLADFLCWGYQDHAPETFLDGIARLPGGHFLHLTGEDVRRGAAGPVRYWQPRPAPRMGADEAAGRFAEILRDSVRLRLRSDVPVSVTLSGGLDSSSVTCLASAFPATPEGGPLRAFTVVYPDPRLSEETFARAVTARCGIELVPVRPESPELPSDWDRFVRAMDEPVDSLSYYSNWKVYESIQRQGVSVLLNGQGGDELLLGYERYRVPFFLHLARRGRLCALVSEALKGRRNASLGLLQQFAYALYFLSPGLRAARRLRLLRPYVRDDFYRLGRERAGTLAEASIALPWPEFLVNEFERFQLPHLLHHEDGVSMHFAVEARNPFLDYRLFELVLGQDIRLLLHDGWSKALLREAMRGTLPETVRLRRDKMGFETPTRRLLCENFPLFSDLLDRNGNDRALDTAAIKRDFLSGRIHESVLCGSVSYLSWREAFGVAA